MANPNTNLRHHHLAAMLLVFLFLTSSSARPLMNDNYFSLAATEPTLNLALPSDGVVVLEENQEPAAGHVSACGHMRVAGKLPLPGTRLTGGKYGPMILNMLPKGPVPPSAPSKGTNNLNN